MKDNELKGQKTIKMTLYFYTTDLLPQHRKTAWATSGVIKLNMNPLHGIKSKEGIKNERQFHCGKEIIEQINALARDFNISFVKKAKMEGKEQLVLLKEYPLEH